MGWGTTITEILLRERPKLAQLATVSEGHFGLWAKKWLSMPYVVYAHGNEILDLAKSEWDVPIRSLREADRVLAVSRFTSNLLRDLGISPDRIQILHPGCDVEYFRPSEPRPETRDRLLRGRGAARVLLTVGNLVARKGHDMVIRALPSIKASVPNLVYLIVGEGPYRPELEKLTTALNVADRVIFAGQLPDEQLSDIYAIADVFVMPSRMHLDKCDVEGFGIVFLEANACGKPVIGGRSGGVPEAILEGVTGLLVCPEDPADLARALERLFTNPDLAHRMGHDGRARAVAQFAWPRFGERLQDVLETVMQQTESRKR
jgi:phosphatidylinositol alpha-1,6-mannosyltransferase